jgi:uncharacterized repeat protein (TIGR03803 family)
MKVFRFGVQDLGVCATVALLAGCASSNSSQATPVLPVVGAPTGGTAPLGHAARPGNTRSSERVLYSFTGGNDGGNAATALVLDAQNNLYGTTVVGGGAGCGTVFKLSRSGERWRENVLFPFDCYFEGKNPHGGVTFDPQGNLAGTTVAGGSGGSGCTGDGCGVAYKLTASGENILHNFAGGNDGFGPGGAVVFDTAGNAYGMTPDGGVYSEGTIYKISSAGHERVIYAFTGGDDGGVGSLGSLLLKGHNLYGVTEIGGMYGAGTAFKLSHNGKGWKFTTLYEFKGMPDAGSPYGGLIADASGNLYGTTYYGGANGLGSVFELSPSGHGKYRERVLYSFKGGSDGSLTTTTLAFGKAGELYGTTSGGGGSCDCGTIFKVNAKTGKEKVLHSFGSGNDGAYSYYGLTPDGNGNFYGTTVAGGNYGQGTVFKFTP